MKLRQLLMEKLVDSSWLRDIKYYGRHNSFFPGEEIITFTTKKSSKTYIIRGLTRKDYLTWLQSKSKGKMYHVLKHYFARGWYETNPFRITDRSKITPKNKITW